MDLDNLKKSRYYPVFFTFAITFFFISLLAFVYGFSKDKIAENKTLFIKKAILKANSIVFAADKEIPQLYAAYVSQSDALPGNTYIVRDAEGKTNVTFLVSGNGLWGTITTAISFRKNGDRIAGIAIVSHNETPGLGGRIEETWFLQQFQDELIPEKGIRSMVGSGTGNLNKDDGAVDAITGATLTSSFFNRIVNNAINQMRGLLGARINE